MAMELIKLAMDKKEQLQASNVTDLSKLVWVELHWHNQQRFANMQLVDIEEYDELELDSLVTEAKPASSKNLVKAPRTFPYPLATNQSRKMPPRPCQNCGSIYHYDWDCASWQKLGSNVSKKPRLASRANEGYQKSYIAMIKEKAPKYEVLCTVFYNIIDNDAPKEEVVAESYLASTETTSKLRTEAWKCNWAELEVNAAELENLKKTCMNQREPGKDQPCKELTLSRCYVM